MYIHRDLEKVIQTELFKNKVIVLYGARQTGKTTLVKHILSDFNAKQVRYIDCELLSNIQLLTKGDETELFSLVEGYKVVVFDEAQSIVGIGTILKTLFDHKPEIQYIATGSSSFDLANKVSEPLTGRSIEFILYPLGITELYSKEFDVKTNIGQLQRFGGYPGIITKGETDMERDLNLLVTQYLYKNVLAIEGLRKPELVVNLLKLLAYQIGNEVSYTELAQKLEVSVITIQKYIKLLEQNFVIFRIGSFSTNKRKEVVRNKKIYFIDMGLRNALVDDFSIPDGTSRLDAGAIFENTMIVERLKYLAHRGKFGYQQLFWRTSDQQEIDYIEIYKKNITAYEFKLNETAKVKGQKVFKAQYPDIPVIVVSKHNLYTFISKPLE